MNNVSVKYIAAFRLIVYLEEDIVETPCLRSENRRETLLAALDHERKVDGTRAGVSSGPCFARAGVGSVAVSTERLAINPGLGNGIDGLVTVKAKELGHNGGGGDLDEDDVIKTNSVEGVEQGKSSLDLVSLYHGLEDITDGQGLSLTSQMVRNGQDGTEIVRWVAPYI